MTNQWFVAATFHGFDLSPLVSSRNECRKHVVMLLDGTFASERDDLHWQPKWRAGTTNLLTVLTLNPGSGQPPRVARGPRAKYEAPEALLLKPDFRIPQVQWDPAAASFPLDLGEQVARARAELSKLPDVPRQTEFREVEVCTYFPSEAIAAGHRSPLANLNHWDVVFRFGEANGREYAVHELLDGTFLPAIAVLDP
jgi:hypothetical protein